MPTLDSLSTDQHTQQQEPTLDFADNTRLQSHSGRYRRGTFVSLLISFCPLLSRGIRLDLLEGCAGGWL